MVCRDVGTQTFTQVIRFFVMIVTDRISGGIKVDCAKIELIVKISPQITKRELDFFWEM